MKNLELKTKHQDIRSIAVKQHSLKRKLKEVTHLSFMKTWMGILIQSLMKH
jgi:hypothetical protein